MNTFICSLPFFKTIDSPHITGGIISNFYLISQLQKIGECEIVTAKCNTSPQIEKVFNVHKLNVKTTAGLFGFLLFSIYNFIKISVLCSVLRKNKKDVILISSTISIPSTYLVSILFKVKHVIICRAYEDFVYGKYNPVAIPIRKKLLKQISNIGLTRVAYNNSYIITNSQWMKNAIQKSFLTQKQMFVLYPPVNIMPYSEDGTICKDCEQMFKVGFINRGTLKGHRLVLDVASLLSNVQFYIFGDIQPFEKSIITPNIILVGWKKTDEIFPLIDIMMMPSEWPEPFGRVAVEAQLYGKPIVVSDIGGGVEAVCNEIFIVPNRIPDIWAKRIEYIIKYYSEIIQTIYSSKSYFEQFQIQNHDMNLTRIINEISQE